MDGFVTDYVNNFRAETGRLPTYEEYAQIMSCHTPEQMPVLSALARGFACFDHWFCEVPSQTFTNRSFFHAGTASGLVLNHPEANFPVHNDAETIFNRLESAGLSWRVYFDPLQCVSATGLVHAPRLSRYFPTHFVATEEFYVDAARGQLPAYAFIEPNMVPPHSDMHPPDYSRLRRFLPWLPRPAALLGGETLLAKIYEAVRTSATPGGSNYLNTLLIVTFDEHGGTYDHVPPPEVPPPDSCNCSRDTAATHAITYPTSRDSQTKKPAHSLNDALPMSWLTTVRGSTQAEIASVGTRNPERSNRNPICPTGAAGSGGGTWGGGTWS
jgi:phospholipase C